jgi:hypothetical protein
MNCTLSQGHASKLAEAFGDSLKNIIDADMMKDIESNEKLIEMSQKNEEIIKSIAEGNINVVSKGKIEFNGENEINSWTGSLAAADDSYTLELEVAAIK